MRQTTLFDKGDLEGSRADKIVNVASIPQLSPFRYPGGKTWLVPRIRQWLSPAVRHQYNLIPILPEHFIEPFAGGGIISLTVAAERLAQHITMVELDANVAAVWDTIINAHDENWLAERILTFDLTLEHVTALVNSVPLTSRDRAFQTIVKNRVYHGGILASGSGLLKWGEDGKGIRSRWYPSTLARRIRHIGFIRGRITFILGDGLQTIATHADDPNAVFFIDPPYTAGENGKRAGRRLYTHNELNHAQLFGLASAIQGDFLMTYDDAEEARALAAQHGFDARLVPMKNTHHAKMTELLIGRNLDWVTLPEPV